MPLTLGDLWNALGTGPWPAQQTADLAFADVVVDSRLAVQDSLFVALRGEETDGHLFVGDAFRRGARAALVERRVDDCAKLVDVRGELQSPLTVAESICFLVPDALKGLQCLAAHWRRQHAQCHVVGITGSVGKTTTKELIASVLSRHYTTLKSLGNYNNEIGLPLTMLRIHPGVQWVVQEMGMYALGEIAELAEIAVPEIGVVTNVGPTHLERLGAIDSIAQAKAELVQALPPDGLAVLNGDDERVRDMATLTSAKRVLFYGLQPHNDLWADKVETRGLEGLWMRFHYGDQSVHAKLPILGRHSAYGALAAAAVGLSLGLAWEEIILGLRDETVQLRLMVVPGMRGTTIVDDTYNASPDSTAAALNLLAELNGRKVAVLGDMLELGSYEVEGHQLVGRRAADVVSILVTVGDLGRLIAEEALKVGMPTSAVHTVEDNDAAVRVLDRVLAEGDLVLVKGSRGMAMENVVAELARGD